ncbi:hypothetical protein AwDysgo_17980 [Bacteroidales bacterium]|nr:hypothetical protein AwDysgo_17980 [Bacteroidales bacterium]
MNSEIKIIDQKLLDSLVGQAKESPRLRMNYNFHPRLEDPINRLLNAMEPGTIFPIHRHSNPDKDEYFLVLRGRLRCFIYNDEGETILIKDIAPADGVFGMEIPSPFWHSFEVLESGTVVYEIKEGPYAPLSSENITSFGNEI